MKNLKTTILLAFSFVTLLLNAQSPQPSKNKYASTDWLSMMRDGTVNVHDVQKAFYKWYKKTHKEDKDKTGTKTGEDDDGAYAFFKRWEWYNVPRADLNGNRPDPYKTSSQYKAYLNNQNYASAHSPSRKISSPGNWSYAGNTNVPTNSNSGNGGDGRVNRVRVMPGNNKTMFACASSGGLWETTNGGTSWYTNTDQLGDLTTSDIAINPKKTNVMYLATGDADGIQAIYSAPGTIGVLKSYDGGNTWDTTGLAYSMSQAGANNYAISELILDPSDTSVLIAATTFGIWRSTNSGFSWKKVQSGWFHSIEFEPGHPSIVYAAASSLYNGGAQFYRSTNNGITWTLVNTGLPSSSYAEGFEIGVSAADSNYVYILADSVGTYGFEGLYRSTNDGQSFSTMALFSWNGVPNVLGWSPSGSDFDGQGWYTLSMAISQTNADSLWVGGVNIWGSTDGGVTWNLTSNWEGNPYVHADIHGIQFIPGTNSQGYVVGCDGGVFTTANGGSSWTDISNNLEIGQQYCIGAEAATPGKWITGWQDNGTNFSSSPWGQVMGGDGMDCFIDWSNNNNFYAETGEGGLNKSTNAGVNWKGCTNGINENGPWVTVWLQDPQTSTTLYAGFKNVWKSTNSAGNWSRISNWGSSSITAIAVDSSNPNYIYASQSNQIQLTTNGGSSWTNITGTLPVGSVSISGIAVNSKNPSHVWVTFSGYTANDEVFESTNAGATWTNISSGLPTIPVNCIVSESGSPDGIYIGTDQGVYYYDTAINKWTFYNTGLPLVMIGDLTIYKPGKELIAATYGRGTWESPLYSNSAVAPKAYFNGSSTSVCAGGSILFTDTSSNSPTSWKWTFTGGNPTTSILRTQSVTYNNPGTYSVKLVVTNQYGVDSLTKASYITVNANPTVTSTTTDVLCYGSNTGGASVSPVGGASPYNYLWTPGGNTSIVVSNLSAGTYSVTITDKNGCTGSTTATITQPASAIDATSSSVSADSTLCDGQGTVTVTGGTLPYAYLWNPGGGTNDTINGKCPGSYCCTITDNNGCTESVCVNIESTTGIQNINNASDITVYPDPNNGSFTISGLAKGQVIELYDALGQKVATSYQLTANGPRYFNISTKANGLYLVRIINADGSLVTQRKILKEQ